MATQVSEVPIAPYSEWDPQDYLREYYHEIMPDERFAMEFLVESLLKTPTVPVALDFGSGPCLHHVFPLVPKAGEIHMAEYLASNREEIQKWLDNADGAHDWRDFAIETLRLEGKPDPSEDEVRAREQATRERVTQVLPGDARDADPLGPERRGSYPLVTSHYCAEGATNDKEEWRSCMSNIAGFVQPGGTLILSACGAANFYCVGDRNFPCAGINALDMLASLNDNGFTNIDLRVRQVPDHSEQGFSSVIFACAVKGSPSSS